MNTEITRVADLIFNLAVNNKTEMESRLSHAELGDLLHECEDLRPTKDFRVRTAAEIIRWGCTEILEKPETL
jgi:hypothetical protein